MILIVFVVFLAVFRIQIRSGSGTFGLSGYVCFFTDLDPAPDPSSFSVAHITTPPPPTNNGTRDGGEGAIMQLILICLALMYTYFRLFLLFRPPVVLTGGGRGGGLGGMPPSHPYPEGSRLCGFSQWTEAPNLQRNRLRPSAHSAALLSLPSPHPTSPGFPQSCLTCWNPWGGGSATRPLGIYYQY